MSLPFSLFNAAAGSSGSPYLAVLTFLAKAVGNYVVNDTNFAGIGKFLPGWVFVSLTPAATGLGQIFVSTDNGTTWVAASAQATNAVPAGGICYADASGVTGVGQGVSTSATVRVTLTTAASDVRLFPLGNF